MMIRQMLFAAAGTTAVIGATLAAPAAAATPAAQAHPVVLTALYNEPGDPAAFEACYARTHLPLVARIKDVERTVLIKAGPNADGSKPAYYRIAQLFVASPAAMGAALGSAAGQGAAGDLKHFADRGATVVVGEAH